MRRSTGGRGAGFRLKLSGAGSISPDPAFGCVRALPFRPSRRSTTFIIRSCDVSAARCVSTRLAGAPAASCGRCAPDCSETKSVGFCGVFGDQLGARRIARRQRQRDEDGEQRTEQTGGADQRQAHAEGVSRPGAGGFEHAPVALAQNRDIVFAQQCVVRRCESSRAIHRRFLRQSVMGPECAGCAPRAAVYRTQCRILRRMRLCAKSGHASPGAPLASAG